jgi:hypothetical protein
MLGLTMLIRRSKDGRTLATSLCLKKRVRRQYRACQMFQKSDEDSRSNPLGFFNLAESYWSAAGALENAKLKTTHPNSPISFLYYHAIELYLKAFLRLHGHSAKELRSKKFTALVAFPKGRPTSDFASMMEKPKCSRSCRVPTRLSDHDTSKQDTSVGPHWGRSTERARACVNRSARN